MAGRFRQNLQIVSAAIKLRATFGTVWAARPCLLLCVLAGMFNSSAAADEDDPLQVAPPDEIVVLDPRVDSEGKPAVIVQPGHYGAQQVEIPGTGGTSPGAGRSIQPGGRPNKAYRYEGATLSAYITSP